MSEIGRKPDRALRDRTTLYEVLDAERIATLSTVSDGLPLVVPLLYARLQDRIVVHGSTGAGALRVAAAGAPVAVSVSLLDALIYADSLFESSANYRSAVVNGVMRRLEGDEARAAVDAMSERLMPGRVAEVRSHLAKEMAATLVLELAITEDNWTAKSRTGGVGGIEDAEVWSGVLPLHRTWGQPETQDGVRAPVAPSVAALAGTHLA